MFTYCGSLKMHERIPTGVKSYACSTCGKMFTQNCHLKMHERIHTGIKPYACSTCGNMFTQNSDLKKQVLSSIHVLPVERCSHKMAILNSMNVFIRC